MKYRLMILALVVGLSALAPATIQKHETPRLPVCSASSDFPCLEPVTGERLIGGEIADPAEWPNSVWIGNCSATVVGEQVLVSAGHCMRNGGTVSFSKGASRYRATCTHHPDYRGNSTADWSFCKVETVVDGGNYEVLNTNEALAKVGTTLMNTGYGCTKWGNGLDGKFRKGLAPITQIPNGSNHDIVTKGNVALCSGDSGGASYLPMQFNLRVVMGVNSRSNTTTTSYMPSWAEPTAVKFGLQWAEKNGVKICGYNEDAKGCRLNAPPEKKFSIVGKTINVAGELKPNANYDASYAKAKFEAVVEELDKP